MVMIWAKAELCIINKHFIFKISILLERISARGYVLFSTSVWQKRLLLLKLHFLLLYLQYSRQGCLLNVMRLLRLLAFRRTGPQVEVRCGVSSGYGGGWRGWPSIILGIASFSANRLDICEAVSLAGGGLLFTVVGKELRDRSGHCLFEIGFHYCCHSLNLRSAS